MEAIQMIVKLNRVENITNVYYYYCLFQVSRNNKVFHCIKHFAINSLSKQAY